MGYIKPQSTTLREALEKPKQARQHVLLNIPEVGDRLRVSKWSIYRLMDEGKLKSVRIRGRRLIPTEEVENFIATQLAEGAA